MELERIRHGQSICIIALDLPKFKQDAFENFSCTVRVAPLQTQFETTDNQPNCQLLIALLRL
ncbi:MAG: hypothetical protein ACI88A_003178 [Paraglaciecola sp.]|jgi:hypothetical protein